MALPAGWTAQRASGWFELHHLVHECGFRTSMAYDLVLDGAFGRTDARIIMSAHVCED